MGKKFSLVGLHGFLGNLSVDMLVK